MSEYFKDRPTAMGQTFVDVHLSVIPQRRSGHVRLCQRSLETSERFTHQLQTVNYRCRKREIVAEKSSSRCLSARRLQLYQRQNLIANTIVCSIRCPQKWLFRAQAMATAFSFFFLQVSLVIRAVELRYRCCIEMVTNFVYILLS